MVKLGYQRKGQETMGLQYANVVEKREHGNPQPRLSVFGYTLRGGSPTRSQVRLRGETRWRRVYCLCFSNAASHFVKTVKGNLYL